MVLLLPAAESVKLSEYVGPRSDVVWIEVDSLRSAADPQSQCRSESEKRIRSQLKVWKIISLPAIPSASKVMLLREGWMNKIPDHQAFDLNKCQ